MTFSLNGSSLGFSSNSAVTGILLWSRPASHRFSGALSACLRKTTLTDSPENGRAPTGGWQLYRYVLNGGVIG